jgi:hypothetical protein
MARNTQPGSSGGQNSNASSTSLSAPAALSAEAPPVTGSSPVSPPAPLTETPPISPAAVVDAPVVEGDVNIPVVVEPVVPVKLEKMNADDLRGRGVAFRKALCVAMVEDSRFLDVTWGSNGGPVVVIVFVPTARTKEQLLAVTAAVGLKHGLRPQNEPRDLERRQVLQVFDVYTL